MSEILLPPEWAPHRAIWTAWPWDESEWGGDVAPARTEIAAMVRALSDGDKVRVFARKGEPLETAQAAFGDCAEVIEGEYGDTWLRDTGPIFIRRGGQAVAVGFDVNGWGGKYVMAGDDKVAAQVAAHSGVSLTRASFVLEGGAIDCDGEGTILTTRQCLLNPNRNAWSEADAERALGDALGVKKIIWIDQGLLNDHTDGHVDNIARFVAPGRVVCMAPSGADDPNAETLNEIARAIEAATDAKGRKLDVVRIPSPGRFTNADGEVIPASHMNFIIGNKVVLVPIYSDTGAEAVAALAPHFPGRKVLGLSAKAILAGGGAFHCITQQEPA
ncbi:MAG: agmatine deiminase family protein [Caulobacterales bacterium]